MKKTHLIYMAVLLLAGGMWLAFQMTDGVWSGVDESVVKYFAEKAGRPPRQPYINTNQGDILLLMFLLAGAGAGFVAGYSFRGLFPGKGDSSAQ